MIDFDDVGDVALIGGASGSGPIGCLFFVLLLVVLFLIALSNSDECAKKHCPNGGEPRLQNHSCQCVQEAQ